MKRSLLDDEDDDLGDGRGAGKPGALQMGFSKKYAERFEHNKKREDLHRLQELRKKDLDRGGGRDDDETSSSSDEEDDGLEPARTEQKFVETLTRIKSRDPSIYSADAILFNEDSDSSAEVKAQAEAGKTDPKKRKPRYLKDVNARQLLEGVVEEEENAKQKKKPAFGYFNEQDELKRAFLEGVRDAERESGEKSGENLLSVKKETREELEKDAQDTEDTINEAEQREADKETTERLKEYFGKDNDLDEEDRYLKEYLLNKGWIDPKQQQQQSTYPSYFDDTISEDEDALDKQDQFEKDYNFRFEEIGVDNSVARRQPRVVEGSVRKKSDTRKEQREKKRDRELEAERARREELKRLKNVKTKEVLEKLSRIRAVAGAGSKGKDGRGVAIVGEKDLDEAFDPDEYDKKMKDAFGEEYYGAEDPDVTEGDDEEGLNDIDDEILGFTPDGAPTVSRTGFAAVKSKLDQSSGDKDEKKKLKVTFEEKLLIDKHLEEYYKLDFEDVVGDLKTRFRYRDVKPNKYGLKTKDIIGLDDKELNQFVSLKKIVPYADQEWVACGPIPRLSSKARTKRALNSEDEPRRKKSKKSNGEMVAVSNGGAAAEEETECDGVVAAAEGMKGSAPAVGVTKDGGAVGAEGGKKKKRNRKKTSSSSLPASRLLSYEWNSKRGKVKLDQRQKPRLDDHSLMPVA